MNQTWVTLIMNIKMFDGEAPEELYLISSQITKLRNIFENNMVADIK